MKKMATFMILLQKEKVCFRFTPLSVWPILEKVMKRADDYMANSRSISAGAILQQFKNYFSTVKVTLAQ